MTLASLSLSAPVAIGRAIRESTVEGDYLEFGVYQGATLAAAYKAGRYYGRPDMRVIGFDSFKGLPQPRGTDAGWKFRKGQYACDVATVRAFLDGEGVPRDRLILVEGFYSKTLTAKMREEIHGVCVAFIDCDLYASTVTVLCFLEPLLKPGAMLLFDDWDCFDKDPGRGERRAFAEFTPTTSLEFTESFDWGGHGKAFQVAE